MWFVADAACASFAIVDHMHRVEVATAVAEAGIKSGIGKAEEVLFMTAQACPIDAFLVGGVDACRIAPPEHPEVIRTVRVMASLAFTTL